MNNEISKEEEIEETCPREHTKKEVLKMMNSRLSFLTFTIEAEEDFPENDMYLPTLDTKVKLMEDITVSFRFFEKRMD